MENCAYKVIFVLLVLVKGSIAGCQRTCISCAGTCTECISSRYLNNGYCYRCNYPCISCNGYNCTSCHSGRYGPKCLSQCTRNCEDCQINSGLCNRCKSGYYGHDCDKDCNRCIHRSCDLHECKQGCEQAYYKDYSSGSSDCSPCSRNCKYCESYFKCTVCKKGFYLYKYLDGKVYCEACSSINNCQRECYIENCNLCKIQNQLLTCHECKNGYTNEGDRCVQKRRCSIDCIGDCNSFGVCLGRCTDGYTGDRCEQQCQSRCLKCSRNKMSICQKCVDDGYYTNDCNVTCPSSCRRIKGASTCRIDNGHCLNECNANFWGNFCNETCSIGCAVIKNNTRNCNIKNGRCVSGCKEGFVGDKCSTVASTVKTSSEGSVQTSKGNVEFSRKTAFTKSDTTMANTKESSVTSRQDGSMNVVVIGSIAGGGVTLIVVASVFIGCYITRRQKPHRTEKTNRHEEEENINIDAIVNSQAVITGNDDCLYAQVNKMNKTNNLDNKEPQTAKNKIAYNVHVDEVMVDALNVDDSDLEEIEEENTRLESEVNIPTSDTYYNTASLLRSRTEVSYLPEYIKKKTDYKKEFENLPVGLTRACTEAMRPNNRIKNRYNGIYAYDATRVVLKSGNYVNANFIDGHKQFPAYIASLGPTKRAMSNFATFWEIIWQERTYKIVMLTTLDEAKKMKCEQYWPEQGSGNNYGDYKVRCTAEKAFSEFIVREFIVARGKETHGVTQYQYTAWPDKTVPESAASLLEFRDTVEQKQLTTAGPMMVHCSAGIGRTGTYIALDILIKEGKDDHSVDIFGCVNALRGQRVQLVQNVEQYVYLHHCVLYALSCAPEPLPVSTMTHFTSNERLSTQHKAFVSLQHMANKDKIMGAKNKTRKENRIGSDIPDDKYRVRLALIEKDYINAVYVNGYQECNKFILAQTPLQDTLEDFVSMLYQERCPCVVCLDDENVLDKSFVQYLPSVNKVATFGQFQVICTDVDRKEDFISRKLKVSRIGVSLSEEVSVFHYQFKGWSSIDCVPRSIQSFLNLVTDVEKTYQSPNSKHPIVVHCSTGAERSRFFCAVSILLEKVALEKEVSVLNTVCQVCSRRRSAFQDIEHLRFCYSCVEQMLEVSDSSTYYNSRNM